MGIHTFKAKKGNTLKVHTMYYSKLKVIKIYKAEVVFYG